MKWYEGLRCGWQVVKKNLILYLLNLILYLLSEIVLMINERACCDWVSMMSGNSGGGVGFKERLG